MLQLIPCCGVGQKLTIFSCRPACIPTHLVHACDTGTDGEVLLVNISLALNAPISIELWRQSVQEAEESANGLPLPPLERLALTCHTAAAPSSGVRRQDAGTGAAARALATSAWTLSNLWDDVGAAHAHHRQENYEDYHADSHADETRHVDAIWSCKDDEHGGISLHWDAASHAVPGRLVSASVSGRLVGAIGPAGGEGGAQSHILVVAAWDQMCDMRRDDMDDAPEGQACRTIFTSTRVAVATEHRPANECKPT